jgi:hypothetical protein
MRLPYSAMVTLSEFESVGICEICGREIGRDILSRLRLQLTHDQQDDQDNEEQSTGAIVIPAAGVTAAAEAEDQKNDQDDAESADCEGATS